MVDCDETFKPSCPIGAFPQTIYFENASAFSPALRFLGMGVIYINANIYRDGCKALFTSGHSFSFRASGVIFEGNP